MSHPISPPSRLYYTDWEPHPISPLSRLYYTDWAEPAFIGTAGMDGSGPRTLISGDLVWPNALTISRETQQLFWADAQQGHIEVADMLGRNRRVLLRSPEGEWGAPWSPDGERVVSWSPDGE